MKVIDVLIDQGPKTARQLQTILGISRQSINEQIVRLRNRHEVYILDGHIDTRTGRRWAPKYVAGTGVDAPYYTKPNRKSKPIDLGVWKGLL